MNEQNECIETEESDNKNRQGVDQYRDRRLLRCESHAQIQPKRKEEEE